MFESFALASPRKSMNAAIGVALALVLAVLVVVFATATRNADRVAVTTWMQVAASVM
jgi:hypothetical protein